MMNCKQCSYIAFSNFALRRHFNKSHCTNKEKCADCNVELPKRSLKLHMKRAHNNTSKFSCDKCNYTCSNSSNMKRHIQLVHLKKTERCPKCNVEVRQGYVKRHIQEIHMNINTISCPVCMYSTNKRPNLQKHIKAVHLNVKEKCEQCGKQVNLGGLATHVKTVHLKIKKYKCSHCTYSAATAQNINAHVKMVHLKEKESCKLCSAKLANKETLKRHLRLVHKKEFVHKKEITRRSRTKDKRTHGFQNNRKKPASQKLDDKEFMDIIWNSMPEEDAECDENTPRISMIHCPVIRCSNSFNSFDDINAHLMSQHELI